MTENWASCFCRVNGALASIMLDLGLRAEAPLPLKPWLLCVWVYFRQPRPDGLSDEQEAPVLFAMEDALTTNLNPRCGALLSGRITTAGRREFYFYAERKDGFAECVKKALKA